MRDRFSTSLLQILDTPLTSLIFHITIGDAELSFMAAGLAVGKSGDTASISADSAQGRSSVITGTTAGVTQFSEVSQITDSYWSGLF